MSSISHQKAVVSEHWDFPNTEIFLSKDVASAFENITGSETVKNII
jgi:hypothetical protein